LVNGLKAAAGDALDSVVVYGSAVRGGYDADHSDVDVMVVLNDDARSVIEAIENAVAVARLSARVECMVLRTDELHSAADVFPLLYDDVRSCHVVLHGDDRFSALVIHDHHKRWRIEQELREMRIRLRRVMIDHQGNDAQLRLELGRKRKQLRSPLHALLQLLGNPADDDSVDATFAAAAVRFNVDLAPFAAVATQHSTDHSTTEHIAMVAAGDSLRALLAATIDAVEHLDRATDGGAP
jgi:predicted nucleotidyltransferase